MSGAEDKALAALTTEVVRLSSALRYEESRAGRIGTHGEGCYKWGPSHYECALHKITELKANQIALPRGRR